jgi:hypothetical protein
MATSLSSLLVFILSVLQLEALSLLGKGVRGWDNASDGKNAWYFLVLCIQNRGLQEDVVYLS